jgi:hypothetical protein
MTHILTDAEAAQVLRCETTDPLMLSMLATVDNFIRDATGHDWTTDSPINEVAKGAARMLLVQWHENPGMQGNVLELSFGLLAVLTQLEALALRYKTFQGRNGAGSICVPGAQLGDTVQTLIGVIGATGSQAAAFEAVITVAEQIQQVSTSDLSAKFFRAYLVPVGSIV